MRRAFELTEPLADPSPRERLLAGGPKALSDAELLAVLLQNGSSGETAMLQARRLISASEGLAGLRQATASSLRGQGLSATPTAVVLTAVEVACRLARADLPERWPPKTPQAIATYLALRYGRADQKLMGAFFLDSRRRLLDDRVFFRGTLSRIAVCPRPFLKQAILLDAAALAIFHNHPTGDPEPSLEDRLFTRRMARAGELMGVQLVDHLIVTPGLRWVSMRQRGGW